MYESRRYEQEQRPRRNEESYERRGDDTNWDRESERSTYSERWMDTPRPVGERDSSRSWRGNGAGTFGGGYDDGRFTQRSASMGGGYSGGPSEWGGSYAGSYAGERENYSGRGPKGYERSDERLREQICERMTDDASLDASEVEIEVKNCEVTLKGTVRDRHQKRRAEDLAESCSGVKDVTNNIRVARDDDSSQRMSQSSGQRTNGKAAM